jgi:hypothetical protein
MRKEQDRGQEEPPVSAKELAEMGFCEKRVLLAHLHGQRLTLAQRCSIDRGRQAHQQYYREGLAAVSATVADRRCFVATCLYGDAAWQTETLRRFRDEVLLRYQLGGWMVEAYYELAPGMSRLLAWQPWLQPPARALVRMLVRMVRRYVEGRGS